MQLSGWAIAPEGCILGWGAAGLDDAAPALLDDGQLVRRLEALDNDPCRLHRLYALLAERAARTFLHGHVRSSWEQAITAYLEALYLRDRPYTGTDEGGPRHQWAMLLDVPLSELTGKAASGAGATWPPYRLLPRGYEPEERALQRGFEELLWRPRRRLRPVDPCGAGSEPQWVWPRADDAVTRKLCAWLADPEKRRMLQAGQGDLFRSRFAHLLDG